MLFDDADSDFLPCEAKHRDEYANLGGLHSKVLRYVILCGLAVLVIFSVLFVICGPFEYGSDKTRPTLAVVGLLLAAALAAFWGLGSATKVPASQRRKLLLIVFAFAISTRLVALFTCPILEIDYYRYIWDGKVAAQGVSPFQFSPAQVLEARPGSNSPLERLASLSMRSESNHTILTRVHYENYTSLYPPVSQLVFAATMKWFPDSASTEAHVFAIKFALVLFDVATLVLVCRLLALLKFHPGWLIAYAWNPLVIKEIANGGHLDSIATFFLVLSLWAIVRWTVARSAKSQSWFVVTGAAALGCGVGAKLFPVVLFPALVVVVAKRSWLSASLFSAVFVVVSCLALLPMYLPSVTGASVVASEGQLKRTESGGAASQDGLVGFFSSWRMNDPVFSTVYLNLKNDQQEMHRPWFVVTSRNWRNQFVRLCQRAGLGGENPAFFVTRLLTLSLFAIFYAWQLMKLHRAELSTGSSPKGLLRYLTWVMALFLLIQPTVNPWYFVWVAPLVCFSNNRGWIIASGLLMLYYARFWFKSLSGTFEFGGFQFSGVQLFDHCFVFVEFGLICIAVLYFCFCDGQNEWELDSSGGSDC